MERGITTAGNSKGPSPLCFQSLETLITKPPLNWSPLPTSVFQGTPSVRLTRQVIAMQLPGEVWGSHHSLSHPVHEAPFVPAPCPRHSQQC
ncbi:hypothetical protein Y1Q_0009150 [Alligator mississippiensis]|uniref:Uncharacterized protein n=1 Tax=Alligator mississippiensis TaxID=8496 RepID=A0A151M2F1_ALLMI|nr:hypothetical protein Y1Q_0009150 [Alligator mississippiensis]